MTDVLSFKSVTPLLETFTLDAVVIAFLFGVMFLYTARNGKERVVALILALYIALLAFIHFPYKEQFLPFTESDTGLLVSNALIFGVFVVLGYLAVVPLLRNRYLGYGSHKWLDAALLSAATLALLIAFSYHVLPLASFYTLDETIAKYFEPSQMFFWWLIAPVVALIVAGRR